MFFRRLEFKIIVSLVLILAGMITVYGWWTGTRQTEVYIHALSANLRTLTRSNAADAAHFIVIREYAGLEQHMLDVANLPDVLNILVVETGGNVLCNIERASRSESPRPIYRLKEMPVPADSEMQLRQEGRSLVCWAPISAGERIGWLRITLSLATADELLNATWRSTIELGALWVFAGTVLIILAVRRPLRAVRELSLFAHELEQKKGATVEIKRGIYEIDMLADALNHSSSRLLLAEQQLLGERERLLVTLQSIGDAVIATDTDERVVLLNNVAHTLTGWSQEEALGLPIGRVLCLEDPDRSPGFDKLLGQILLQRRVMEALGPVRLTSRDGGSRTVTINAAPIIDSTDNLAGMVLVVHDVTEKTEMENQRRRLEEKLLQSQKMEAVGQLAGGVAHDFNNILGVIIGRSELAMLTIEQSNPLYESFREIMDAANRSADITRQLLAFSRQQPVTPKVLDLNVIISNMLKMLRRLIGEDISLGWSPGIELWKVKLDPAQFDQIMANLCVNARDAIAGVGKIDIRTENVTLDAADMVCLDDIPPGRYVMVTVSDNGSGMSREVIERIFEPFFTTKGLGRGTGLGLATVFGIVKQNSGSIDVTSTPGVGTTFKIYFPADTTVAEGDEVQTAVTAGSGEVVLIVEDEPNILQIAATMLSALGYTVMTANSPWEAIELVSSHQGGIALLITDIIMPGMNGRDLSQRLQALRPGMKCLYMSGYTADIIAERGNFDDGSSFLQKPFTMRSLGSKVMEVLRKE